MSNEAMSCIDRRWRARLLSMKKLAAALSRALRESGVERGELLKKTKIGATAMSRYLNAKALPTPESLAQIMAQLPEKQALDVFSAYIKETLPRSLSNIVSIGKSSPKNENAVLREDEAAYQSAPSKGESKSEDVDEELEDSIALLKELANNRSDIKSMLINLCDALKGK